MPEAKEGEVTIVEVETVGFNKTKVDRMMTLLFHKIKIPFEWGNAGSRDHVLYPVPMHYCAGEGAFGGYEGWN